MQRCQFCGYELSDNTRFCVNCGRDQFGTTLATSNPTFASSPDEFASTIATPPFQQWNQPAGEDEEERRRRGAMLPPPIPLGTEGPLSGGQAPWVQGTPSFNNVPTIQGTPTGMAGSVPSTPYAASLPGQQASYAPQPSTWTNQPAPQFSSPTSAQSQASPAQYYQNAYPNANKIGSTTKAASGGISKTILIITVGVIIVVVGASGIAFAFRSHIPGLTTISPTTSNNSSSNSSNAHSCGGSTGIPCSGTTSQSSPQTKGQSTGTFNFTGDVSGTMVNTSFPICGLAQGNTYVMQVIGNVGGTQYKFLIGILSYSGPGTYTSHLTVDLIHASNNTALGNDGRFPVSIIITNGGKAGTVNSDLEGILSGFQLSKGHVSAKWACA
jgi:hypothetical protein